MPLDLPTGASCFVDSNILYYALVPITGLSEQCVALLNRAAAGEVTLHVSVPVLSDTIHKVMATEATQITGCDRTGIVTYLRKHNEVIAQLQEYPRALERLASVPMTVLPVDDALLRSASAIAMQHRLLTNDAIIVALMQREQLTHLVTNDQDFQRVPNLTVWMPR